MIVASGPNFVEQETVGQLDGAVEVVGDAAVFATSGRDQSTEFGFEEKFLARFGAQDHDQRYGVLGELGACVRVRAAFCCGLHWFASRHDGGIVLQDRTGKVPDDSSARRDEMI